MGTYEPQGFSETFRFRDAFCIGGRRIQNGKRERAAYVWQYLASDPMPDEMDMLLKITDKEHIVYGSDYPYVLPSILLKKKAALDKELTKRNQMKQVYVDNAKKLIHAKIF